METYNDIYLGERRKLRAAGVSMHDLEARLIVAHATGKTREELLSLSRYFVTDPAMIDAVNNNIERRLNGEPVAYIVGEWEFYGLPLYISDAVLIPRVDTEILVDEAIKLMKQRDEQTRLLDLCAGSGCVGLAIAANVPDCRVVLADSSESALAICRANIFRNRLSRNVTAIIADALETPPALLGTFDAIVCNPPYIPTGELIALDESVRDYEPVLALDGGQDGFDFFRGIAANWAEMLKEEGIIAFECGRGQISAVREIMEDNGFHKIKTHFDTLGVERVIVGIKR